ncbi:AraC-like ligand-binding domain-containing protein [Streptomyces sp. F-1]|uniref:AraC-like ligand-binding domain-containing protein n=1 Tax=Streptomyces sp. F-1 TaxID=463642 RepID=UPI00085CDEE2|nr:helix-turn-helix domain-containing protein [Streptomyces sp. F-1]SFY51820.1 Transcriptional activator NphR [Streptomyces sp. F-1]
MLEDVFDAENLPVRDRVEAWREITASALIPNEFRVDPAAKFRASLRAANLGGAQVAAMTYGSHRTRRTPRLIRRSDPEMYAVGLVLRGVQGILQAQCHASLDAGELVVYSTSHPFEAVVDVRDGVAASVVVQVPRALVPLPPNRVNRLLAARLPGHEGVGRLLAGFLVHLSTDTGPCRPADGHRLGGVLVDLLTAWLAHHADAVDRTPAETRRGVQLLEVQHFIRRHLGDAGLTPAAVAAAHHISLRSLHRLFREHAAGTTVAAYIRDQRLAAARRDLADPRLASRPVHATAARWGFPRAADFTRAFRTAYGTTPSEYRASAQ